jgi:NitT/TauT family transport system substrate-binding protein
MTFTLRRPLWAAFALLLAFPGAVTAADRVTVGTVGNNSDAGFFIAADKGYFKDEGLDVEFVPFDGAQKMMAPLGTGDLDIGGGAASASLYNSAARNIGIKIVADRSRMMAGYQFQTLMVRKTLIDSGRFKELADLKGLKVALLAPGGSPGSTLNEAAKKGGIRYEDIERIYLPFPAQVGAFKNGAIDASLMIEPFATAIVNAGDGVRFASTEDFDPGDQIGLVFFSEKFVQAKRAIGQRFIKAYVRALRDYNDAVQEGRFAKGPKGDEIVRIMAQHLHLKEEALRASYVQAISPDGRPNDASLRKDLTFFKAQGDVTDQKISVDTLLDLSFVDQAVKDLGPYKASHD